MSSKDFEGTWKVTIDEEGDMLRAAGVDNKCTITLEDTGQGVRVRSHNFGDGDVNAKAAWDELDPFFVNSKDQLVGWLNLPEKDHGVVFSLQNGKLICQHDEVELEPGSGKVAFHAGVWHADSD